MAVRSGAGTGVVVSLVVFVLTTVFLLVLTIVFYAGQQNERELRKQAEDARDIYIERGERNMQLFKAYEAAAPPGTSVARHIHDEYERLMRYVAGQPSSMDGIKASFASFGIPDDGVVLDGLRNTDRDLKTRQSELDAANRTLASMQGGLQAKEEEIEALKAAHEQEVEAVQGEIASYRDAAEEYARRVQTTIDELNDTKTRLREQYQSRIDDLEQENNGLLEELQVLRGRVDEFERILKDIRVKSADPDKLVDGYVIDLAGGNDQVFIDRGRDDRIVLGMTFEVYDDSGSIRVDQRTGEMPRGKASLQVIKVGDTTSTCKITRSVPGRPVVRNDVIANAVYDPEYIFKFLVHGKFDVDGDGKPSEAEAEYLRRLVQQWGGQVVYAEELPGDLDFLVLGSEPPPVPQLRDNATDPEIAIWLEKKKALEKYEQLFAQAREAQIPVLNANRFFILIGHTER
ncbi:MAG: hypothetical protein JSV91_02320 [Phycisphaerales bacterium]|nr:MAG: hypothetical protein JSV91_02320 [Phycisphaerales bacterium]